MASLKQTRTWNLGFTLLVFLSIFAVGISVVALYFVLSSHESSQVVIESSAVEEDAAAVILKESEQTLSRAEDAVSSAELVLSFLEGASVLAGALVIAISLLGLSSLRDLRNDTEAIKQDVLTRVEQAERQLIERVERAESQLLSKAEQLSALEQAMEQLIQQNQARIDEQIQSATRSAQRAFEALSHHVMAQRLARENNVDAAIKACRDAHELDPDSIPNNYLLGVLLIRKDELDEAIEHLTEAFTLTGADARESSAPSQAALGLALRRKGDVTDDVMERNRLYNLAESHLLEATRTDPQLLNENRESYLGVLGSLYRRQGRIQDAIAIYNRAVQVTPRRSYPEINLAMLYLEQGDQDKAEQHRHRAEEKARRRLEDTPEDYWAKYDVGLACLLRGDEAEARVQFEEAIELTPDVMTLDSVLSRLYFLRNSPIKVSGLEDAITRLAIAQQRFYSKSSKAAGDT